MMSTNSIDWTFESARVRGRLVDERDRQLYLDLYTDASVMRHIAEPSSLENATTVFAKALKHNANSAARARYWQLSHLRTGQRLGLAALVRDAAVSTRGELGLMLLPHAQHTGIGLQALVCLIGGVLSQRWGLGMDEVTGRHAVDNIGAVRLVEYLEFESFDIETPTHMAWRMTKEVWNNRLTSRASAPQH